MAVVKYFGRKTPDYNGHMAKTGEGHMVNLVLELEDNVDTDTNIGINFQRVFFDGTEPALAAISDADTTYFYADGLPTTMTIKKGNNTTTFGPIRVRTDATQNNTPINFPDAVLFTAFVPQGGKSIVSDVVTFGDMETASRKRYAEKV